MHVHIGKSRNDHAVFTPSDLKRIFETSPVTHAVIFPIDVRGEGKSYTRANRQVLSLARRDKRLLPFCRIKPRYPREALAEIRYGLKHGMRGIKIHTRSDEVFPAQVYDLFQAIRKMKLPVMLHTGNERHCQPGAWEKVFSDFPQINFIIAHGGKGAYRTTGRIARRYKNVYVDTSVLSKRRTEVILELAGPGKVVFASDSPYSHPLIEYVKFDLILGKNTVARRKIFRDNPLKLLGGLD